MPVFLGEGQFRFHRFFIINAIDFKPEQIAKLALVPFVIGELAEVIGINLVPPIRDFHHHVGPDLSIIKSNLTILIERRCPIRAQMLSRRSGCA